MGVSELLDRISTAERAVCVVGSLNADYSVRCRRLPQPGETVAGQGLALMAGGKSSNQAAAAACLGATVRMVGAVGTDSSGDFLLGELARAGVDASYVARLEGPSGTAVIEVDESAENSIVVSPGANGRVDAAFVEDRRGALEGAAVLGLCLEIPMAGVVAAAQAAREAGARVLLNNSPFAADLPRELIDCTDVLLVNEHELAALLGIDEPKSWEDADWTDLAGRLAALGFAQALVTLGAAGSVVLGAGAPHRVAGVPVDAVDTTGCGDAFMGAVLAGLAAGADLCAAAELASYVSAYAACGQGAQPSYGTAVQVREAFGL